MHVVRATAFGGPEVLEAGEAPDPTPGARQLLVDVAVAEVLFLDTRLRAGWGREYFTVEPPFVPGVGIAGVVSAVGAGVDGSWVGRRVVAGLGGAGEYGGGGYAERAVAAVDTTYPVPDGVDLRDAVAALHDGMMGVSRMEKAEVKPGEVVLVTAAAGSIGTWLVPLAARAGAVVVAAARGERKLALARDRGAAVTVDYSDPGWAGSIGPVDVVFDGAGGDLGTAAFGLTSPGSRFFSYGAASGEFPDVAAGAQARGVRVVGIDDEVTPADGRRYVTAALDLVAAGAIRPVIGQAVALADAGGAHAAMAERRVPGKTLLLTGRGTA